MADFNLVDFEKDKLVIFFIILFAFILSYQPNCIEEQPACFKIVPHIFSDHKVEIDCNSNSVELRENKCTMYEDYPDYKTLIKMSFLLFGGFIFYKVLRRYYG